jgi:hypothetical protein
LPPDAQEIDLKRHEGKAIMVKGRYGVLAQYEVVL